MKGQLECWNVGSIRLKSQVGSIFAQSVISCLCTLFHQTGSTSDRSRSCRSRKTAVNEGYLQLTASRALQRPSRNWLVN